MLSQIQVVNHLTVVKEVLLEEASAIENLVKHISNDIERVIDVLLNCKGKVIVTGVGKSGIIGRKIAATFSSTGTPSLFLHPAEGLHGDLGMITSSDVILALSNSGESEEVLNILPSIKRIGAKIIAFVGNSTSTLANRSDYIVCTGKVKEACPLGLAPTTSTTLALSLGDGIAIALLKARNFQPENFAVFHPGGSLGKKLLLSVNDVIEIEQKNPIAYEDSGVKEVIFNMTQSGLGAVSVIDRQGKLIGILTDGDIRRALSKGEDIITQSVKELYNVNPIKVKKDILAAEALNLMEKKKVNVLPVIDEENVPIAMLHLHNLTKMGL